MLEILTDLNGSFNLGSSAVLRAAAMDGYSRLEIERFRDHVNITYSDPASDRKTDQAVIRAGEPSFGLIEYMLESKVQIGNEARSVTLLRKEIEAHYGKTPYRVNLKYTPVGRLTVDLNSIDPVKPASKWQELEFSIGGRKIGSDSLLDALHYREKKREDIDIVIRNPLLSHSTQRAVFQLKEEIKTAIYQEGNSVPGVNLYFSAERPCIEHAFLRILIAKDHPMGWTNVLFRRGKTEVADLSKCFFGADAVWRPAETDEERVIANRLTAAL